MTDKFQFLIGFITVPKQFDAVVGWLQSASSTCLKPSQLMRGCYDEPSNWGSVALPIPYRVHAMKEKLYTVEIPNPFQFLIGFMQSTGTLDAARIAVKFQFLIGFM